ncbi:MAG: acyl-CoA dehydrogenase family protein [Ilumatobacteraceae bacterium]|jgi:alkylation response protein AidB-like acyl-CoA dehydrogenase|nr:acyl-CoA dehydrogenase family protein [Ilumatobacteraceae bacterium]MDP4702296.1 acyl-CoA dehydrogenase family protein [Ilumatobacteraceae bacterium]
MEAFPRTIFDEVHQQFRSTFRSWLDKEVVPHHEEWEAAGITPRELWLNAGKQGFLGLNVPGAYGGGDTDDYHFAAIMAEEIGTTGVIGSANGITLHNDIVLPYFLGLANEEQRARFLPGMVTGEVIGALGITEPNTGSDVAGIRTTGLKKGGAFIVNGAKTFISNGINSDVVIVVCRTDPEKGHRGISLLLVERGMKGFERGRNLNKLGMHAQDTAELFFSDVEVPAENVLGEEGNGFVYLMTNLAQERLGIAVGAVAVADAALHWTLDYTKERKAFGQSISQFQNSKFLLAELATEVQIAQVYVDRCVELHCEGKLSAEQAAAAKFWTTELQNKVVDRCLQLHGGYGYMMEYPIARAWADSRIQTIYGGTTEIMKEIVGRSITK